MTADLAILSGAYLLVRTLVRLGDWYSGDWARVWWSVGVYTTASMLLTWWYAPWFVTIITPAVAITLFLVLGMVLGGVYYGRQLQPPWQLREDLYVAVTLTGIAAPMWRTVATEAFMLLWQNVVLISVLLALLAAEWSIWFVLGCFLMGLALWGIGMRVWRNVTWYVPWIIFIFTLPALIYVVLFFPLGLAWLLLFQLERTWHCTLRLWYIKLM